REGGVEGVLVGSPANGEDHRTSLGRHGERAVAFTTNRRRDVVREDGERIVTYAGPSKGRMGGHLAAPAPATLLHALLVQERRPFQIDADEDAARRRPGERHLPRVERVAGEEPRVLPTERARGPRDRRGARDGRAPRPLVQRVVGLHRAGEGD